MKHIVDVYADPGAYVFIFYGVYCKYIIKAIYDIALSFSAIITIIIVDCRSR